MDNRKNLKAGLTTTLFALVGGVVVMIFGIRADDVITLWFGLVLVAVAALLLGLILGMVRSLDSYEALVEKTNNTTSGLRERVPFLISKKWVALETIKGLESGCEVRHKVSGNYYLVTANYGGRATGVTSVDITNPGEWEVAVFEVDEQKPKT